MQRPGADAACSGGPIGVRVMRYWTGRPRGALLYALLVADLAVLTSSVYALVVLIR